jgi:hypothetical protein
VSALLAHKRDGRLPVRVSYQGRVPVLPGVTVTRSGGGTAFGYITQASGRAFGAALDRQYAADRPHASYGADGMFAGGTTIGLAGTALPARPVHSEYPMRTLTVKATNLAGKPDTGDLVVVFNVDNVNGSMATPSSRLSTTAKRSTACQWAITWASACSAPSGARRAMWCCRSSR